MSALQDLLERYRTAAATHREQGTYFEELIVSYLKTEPLYRELYRDVVPYAEWAGRQKLDKRDAGIDLVAETFEGEVHAIQCKLYAHDYRVQKSDIDSFFTASGKKPFARRILVATTDHFSEHAEEALRDQQPPVTKIDLLALESSLIDWARFKPRSTPHLRKRKEPFPHQRDAVDRVLRALAKADRGKLIMACGTGKTFTSLKIAEKAAGEGGRVLFNLLNELGVDGPLDLADLELQLTLLWLGYDAWGSADGLPSLCRRSRRRLLPVSGLLAGSPRELVGDCDDLHLRRIFGGKYIPFEGICLTDTFQLYEKDDLISRMLVDNSKRRARQKKLDIRVVVGNPPYSIGQESENDNNANVTYPMLDERIAETYAKRSDAKLAKGLYDSYVRAIRWASDRVGRSGIVGFVTNANFIEANTTDGLRKCLADEFSSLYVFHLRGNQRTAGELSRKEGGKVFGSGSRAPVAISLLVKNPSAKTRGQIFLRDVGDYLTREQKLEAVASFGSVAGISEAGGWTQIQPDEHGDWLKQRDAGFGRYIGLGIKDKKDRSPRVFEMFSLGVVTNRDAWASGPSKRGVGEKMASMIAFYETERVRFEGKYGKSKKTERDARVDGFIDADATRISWTRSLKNELAKGTRLAFSPTRLVPSLYRPFTKQWLYFDRQLNEMVYQMPRLFPKADTPNRVIGVSASQSRSGYSVLMADMVPSLHAADMVGSQFFPLYVYASGDDADDENGELFASSKGPVGTGRRDGISDAGLAHFRAAYPGKEITKEDVFYYVYGVLHSAEYRDRYVNDLGKELPRIPRMKTAAAFSAFSRAGRSLAELHLDYEHAAEFSARIEGPVTPSRTQLRVEKMRFGKGKDKTVIHYNDFITVRDIPLEAYDYVVNGKPAIEWVMERQAVTSEKASGIVSDANAWANETVGDARYPLSLLLRVITVSLETMRTVRRLPPLDILEADKKRSP